jgi:hypothetical protein
MKQLLLIFLVFSAVSCTVSVTKETTTAHYPAITVDPFITGEKNGTPFAFKVDATGDYFSEAHQGYISGSNPNAPYCFYYGMNVQTRAGSSGTTIGELYEVLFKNMVSSYINTEPDFFYSAFDHPPTNFITEDQYYNNAKGVEINYWSPDNKTYSTSYGSQSGSSMTITNTTRSVMPGGDLKTEIVRGTFKCKLYNRNNPSEMISINNGKFCIRCQSYY